MPIQVTITLIICITVISCVAFLVSVARKQQEIDLQVANAKAAETLLKLAEFAERHKEDDDGE